MKANRISQSKWQTMICFLFTLLLTSCDTLYAWSTEHPILLVVMALAIIAFWLFVIVMAIRMGLTILAYVFCFFLPFKNDWL